MLPLLALVASECGPPRCTEPLTTGATFDAEYMQLDASAGCQHAVPSASELRTVLKGSWLQLCGGSNMQLHFMAYANALESGSPEWLYPDAAAYWNDGEYEQRVQDGTYNDGADTWGWPEHSWYLYADLVYDVSDVSAPKRVYNYSDAGGTWWNKVGCACRPGVGREGRNGG